MIENNNPEFNLIKHETAASKISVSKNAYQGIKKDFDKFMIDGFIKSFSVVQNDDRKAHVEVMSEDINSNSTTKFVEIFSNKSNLNSSPSSNEIFRKIEGKLIFDREINTPNKTNVKNNNGNIGRLVSEIFTKKLVDHDKYLNSLDVKQNFFGIKINKHENDVSLILHEGEYVLNIHGKDNVVNVSNVLEYIKYFRNEYELDIKKVYVNNKLVFEEKYITSQSLSTDKDDSSINIYF